MTAAALPDVLPRVALVPVSLPNLLPRVLTCFLGQLAIVLSVLHLALLGIVARVERVLACVVAILPRVLQRFMRLPYVRERFMPLPCIATRLVVVPAGQAIILPRVAPRLTRFPAILPRGLRVSLAGVYARLAEVPAHQPKVLAPVPPDIGGLQAIALRLVEQCVSAANRHAIARRGRGPAAPGVCGRPRGGLGASRRSGGQYQEGRERGGRSAKHVLPPSKNLFERTPTFGVRNGEEGATSRPRGGWL